MDEHKRRPETAISVEELPDIVLQSDFRAVLDEQFNVSGNYIGKCYWHIYYITLLIAPSGTQGAICIS